jgi:hypothetical protein
MLETDREKRGSHPPGPFKLLERDSIEFENRARSHTEFSGVLIEPMHWNRLAISRQGYPGGVKSSNGTMAICIQYLNRWLCSHWSFHHYLKSSAFSFLPYLSHSILNPMAEATVSSEFYWKNIVVKVCWPLFRYQLIIIKYLCLAIALHPGRRHVLLRTSIRIRKFVSCLCGHVPSTFWTYALWRSR